MDTQADFVYMSMASYLLLLVIWFVTTGADLVVACNSNLIFCFPKENVNGHNDDIMCRTLLHHSATCVASNENHSSNKCEHKHA